MAALRVAGLAAKWICSPWTPAEAIGWPERFVSENARVDIPEVAPLLRHRFAGGWVGCREFELAMNLYSQLAQTVTDLAV